MNLRKFALSAAVLAAVAGVLIILLAKQASDAADAAYGAKAQEVQTALVHAAKALSAQKEFPAHELLSADLKSRGIELLVAEKLLFPAENSVRLHGFTVAGAYSKPLLAALLSVDEEALLQAQIELGGFYFASKLINAPRRSLIVAAVTQASLQAAQSNARAPYRTAQALLALLTLAALLPLAWLSRSAQAGRPVVHKGSDQNDPLTGLPARNAYFAAIARAKNPALLLLNVDRFREINDFYGHQVGDFFLQEIAKILHFYLPEKPKAVLYRLGGDEFGVLLEDPAEGAETALAEQIAESMPKEAVFYEDFEISCSLSIGVAKEARGLLEKADIALRTAKKDKHKKVVRYTPDMDMERRFKTNLTWARKIHDAIVSERIVPHFQPIVRADTKTPVKYEALVRLIDDTGKEVLPFMFLKTAKLSKQYAKLSRMMLRRCFADFSLRKDDLSVNLSIDDITNEETVTFIKEQIRRYNLQGRITFEILESEEIEDFEHTRAFIQQMREFGCKFAIDDFGSGYSNFINIARLNVDFLKIDASLISTIDTDEKSYLIVKSIVQFAKLLGLETVAEYVYNEAVMQKAVELGVDYLQGFQIAKPERIIR
ncbi:MAG: EAL domain-containing protein [Campylobacterales bacterium]